ncbi:MAG: Gfo/Idh/MocA family oxidoreductase [Desulfobacterales bacterium]|jgi:predicted dehydrogenase
MNIAIIGAGRNRNGIGPYVARYFHKNRAGVTSALGATEKSARRAVDALKVYGIDANAYWDFDHMMVEERPNAVVIASPIPTHYEYLKKSIESGLHIFCEKPFFWHPKGDMAHQLDRLFEKAASKNLTIAMNSQWPFSIPFYEKLCGPLTGQPLGSFFMHLEPICSGKEMILDALPHALSILHFVLGAGEIHGLEVAKGAEKISMRFDYHCNKNRCETHVRLESKEQQPRNFKYGFNHKIINRVLELDTYTIYFRYQNRRIKISDPLELSVRDFMAAVGEQREPVIGKSHIISSTMLLKKIYDHSEM